MAIIQCPNCRQRISSRATSCSHCGHKMGGAGLDPGVRAEAHEEYQQRRMRKLRSRLDLGAAAAASTLALVFGLYWWQGRSAPAPTQHLYAYVFAALVIAYVVLRTWKIIIRRK